jgi:hypothetical protein
MNSAATLVLVAPIKLFLLEGPYKYGKVAASQLPSVVDEALPLNERITAWPFPLCQNPIVAVSFAITGEDVEMVIEPFNPHDVVDTVVPVALSRTLNTGVNVPGVTGVPLITAVTAPAVLTVEPRVSPFGGNPE